MHLKSRLIATAAVIAMAAAAIYGSTFQMSGMGEDSGRLSWFGSKKETIYFWYADDKLTNYINSAAVSFGEKEGVRVIPILTSDSEYLEAVNRETLHSEQIPDVYLLSNDSLEKAYLAGLASEVQDEHNVCNETNFPKAAMDAVSYKGKTIAYPLYYETSALLYNETYLENWATQQAEKEIAGASEETNSGMTEPADGATLDLAQVEAKKQEYLQQAVPVTMDDILNFADTFDVPEGVEAVMKWDVSDIFYNYWIVGNYMIVGGDSGDDVQNIDINNEETTQCLEVYKALNQFFFIESDTVTYDSVIQDFLDGKTVFTIVTTDAVARLQQAREDGSFTYDYGITTMPMVSEQLQSRSMSVTNALVVNGYSEHKEVANAFAAYMTTEYYDTFYARTGKASANIHANEDNPALQIFGMEYASSVPLPKMIETGNFWLQLEILFSKVWNGADVTALVQELADRMAILTEAVPQ